MSAPVYTRQPTPAQRICGWCRVELAPGTLPATHGLCPRCYVLCELDVKRRQEGPAGRLPGSEG